MHLAPRYACALSLAAAAACSGVEPLATLEGPALRVAMATGGNLPVSARWANDGSGILSFLNRENSSTPQLGSRSVFTFDAAATVDLGSAFVAGQGSFIEVEGSHAGTTLFAGREGSAALVFDRFVAHEETHEILLPSLSGGFERASWSWGAAGSHNSYTAFRNDGHVTFAGSGEGGTARLVWVLRLDVHNVDGVKAILGRAIEEGTGVRLGLEPLPGGAFVFVSQIGGSRLVNSQRASGSFTFSAAGTVTRRP